MEIRIIKGAYGWRKPGGSVRPVMAGNTVDVSDAEAARLVGLGVAAYVDEEAHREEIAEAPPAKGKAGRSGKGKTPAEPDAAEGDAPPVIEAEGPEV